MARPVSIVTSGAPPFVSVSSGAPIATPVADGKGPPITLVSSGAPPIVLLSDDGTALAGLSWAPDASYAWDFITNEARFAGNYEGVLSNTPNWTFTRASTGYAQTSAGALTAFASGELRRTDKGVLIEGAGTNLCLQSQDFATTWARLRINAFGSGSVVNATTAPDGTSTADFICEDTNNDTHFIRQAVTVSSGVAHTFSVYAKAGTRSIVTVGESATTLRTATFDLSAGTVSNVGGSITATITALADGWYRCAITYTTASTTFNADIGTRTTSGAGFQTYTGDGASGLYLWGAQLEATAYASSYVPTTTGSATRAADSLTVTGVTGLDFPLTLFAQFSRAVDTGANEALFAVDAGSDNERVMVRVEAADRFSGNQRAASTDVAAEIVTGALAVGTVYKGATRFALNDVKSARGGTLSTGDTSAAVPSTPTTIRIGSQISSANPCYNYLRRLAIYSRALTDAELQAVTT